MHGQLHQQHCIYLEPVYGMDVNPQRISSPGKQLFLCGVSPAVHSRTYVTPVACCCCQDCGQVAVLMWYVRAPWEGTFQCIVGGTVIAVRYVNANEMT